MGSGGMRMPRSFRAWRERRRAALAASGSKGGAGPPVPIDIGPYRGWSIQQVEERLRTLDHEEIFFFNRRGEVVAAYRGEEEHVSFPHRLYGIVGLTVTHNHTTGDVGVGGSFSFPDVRHMLRSKWASIRTVTGGQGEWLYILRRGDTSKAKINAYLKRLRRDEKKFFRKARKTQRVEHDRAVEAGKSKAVAAHIAHQKAFGKYHVYHKRLAHHYGFDYIVRKRP